MDGVTVDWPFDAAYNTKLETFIYVFSKKGYEPCIDGSFEVGFRKICFYGYDTDNVSHASRQYPNTTNLGKWTSKLGDNFKIIHGCPFSLEGAEYGKVLQFMKCIWP